VILATADLADAHGGHVAVCAPVFRSFGGRSCFSGPIRTLQVFEDNALVRSALDIAVEDAPVLVVDGGGSLRCALLGGNLVKLAADNGWAGVVVNGCVRDCAELAQLPIGVLALASHPRRSEKGRFGGVAGGRLHFADVHWRENDWVVADADGVVVLPADLVAGRAA
jgi:regulator of ribonuclease activity A